MKKRCQFGLSFSLVVLLSLAVCGSSFAELMPSQPDFPNAELLVSADSVQSSMGEKNLLIIDARSSGYDTGHIPGAINIKHGDYWTWGKGLLPVAELNSKLSAAGLKRGMTFVIYDDTSASWGAAGRIFWMLEYLGCNKVHVLDGGWDKWVADGRPTETTINTLPAKSFEAVVRTSVRTDKTYIAANLSNKNFAVIDTRTDEEYIGWQLYGEARGGHISGSIQIPYAWFFKTDKTLSSYGDLLRMFFSRGITKDKEVTAYCTVGIRSGFAYFALRLMGYKKASNYDASMAEWSADEPLPMEKAPRYSSLVHPSWVKAVMDYHAEGSTTSVPAEYPYARDRKFIIFESSRGTLEDSAEAYKAGHIPGAIHMDTSLLETGYPGYFLQTDPEILHAALGSMGITADTTVVVYSDSFLRAGRQWFLLKHAGVEDVRILNGAYAGWLASGYEGETQINYPVADTFVGAVHPEYLATADYIQERFEKRLPMYLGDVRAYDEYVALISGYSRLVAKGRIPTAIWLEDGDAKPCIYNDPDGTFRSYSEIRNLWKLHGVASTGAANLFDKELIFYCGNGYRSSVTLFYAYLMGYDNARNYSSGWFFWSTNFTEDASCTDSLTPGWCQTPTGRPIVWAPF